MPSDVNEPALEELSAYLDHELDSEAHARVAAHIAGCQDCQARLDGLRQTTYAVRALPMETPPRAFTIAYAVAVDMNPLRIPTNNASPRTSPSTIQGRKPSTFSTAISVFPDVAGHARSSARNGGMS